MAEGEVLERREEAHVGWEHRHVVPVQRLSREGGGGEATNAIGVPRRIEKNRYVLWGAQCRWVGG